MGKTIIKEIAAKYRVKYMGEETVDLIPGEIYDCIAECYFDDVLNDLRIIDGSGEDYLYSPEDFKKLK